MALAFIDAQDMIELLESYFLTGYETEDARNAFQALQMGGKDHHNETFAEFRGRFTSMAILGEIPASEQFYYMWEKITPQLRSSAAPLKRRWNYNFAEMAADLLALDKEKKRNTELVAQSSTRAPSVLAPIHKPTTPIPTARSSTPKPFIPFRAVSATPQVTRPFQPRPSTTPGPTKVTPVPPPTAKCYNCGQDGHYRSQCPNPPVIREIGVDEEEEMLDEFSVDHTESDPIQEENEEA